jgi:hypothetical protein
MAAGTYNITIEQGATFTLPLTYKDADDDPVPLTDALARMQIRQKVTSTDTIVDLDSDTLGGITISDPGGITVVISDEVTAAITIKTGVYDLEIEWVDGTVTRLLQGTVTVSPEVTR